MANEYLRRKPTGSGNRRRWTVAFWMKNTDPTQGYTSIIGAGQLSPDNIYNEIWYNGSQIGLNLDNSSAADNYNITANPILRDPNSWRHVVVSLTDEGDNANTRVKFYINGELDYENIVSFGFSTFINTTSIDTKEEDVAIVQGDTEPLISGERVVVLYGDTIRVLPFAD